MTHITIATKQEHTGILVSLAAAPEEIGPGAAGREVGEVRFNPADQTATLSVGARDKVTLETFRRAGGSLAKWIAKNKVIELAVDPASFGPFSAQDTLLPAPDQIAFALAEGLTLGSFRFDKHKSKKEDPTPATVYFLDESFKSTLERAVIISEATNLARAWAHEPANVINPVSLAERVQELAKETGLKCTVLDDKQLAGMGAGAIVAVGQGSATPSRLIVLEYQPSPKNDAKPVALIGKAITFDTGGYSIKTTPGMVGMKYDKCGAMAVLGTMVAAAQLKLPIPLVGLLAASENMISDIAYRPNDILKTLSGKTVEITSTDAEGRLVLCDALAYAQQTFNPRAMVDVATLTGGIVTALGSNRAGLFSNNDDLANALFNAGASTHERLWRMPLDEEYFELIKSVDADMKNSAGVPKASPIIGATFLKQFVNDKTPWAHLDIAGVSNWDADMPYCPKGASGFGVRLLVEYLSGLE